MQKNDRGAVGCVGRVEAMDEGQVPVDHPRFTRQRELRQHRFDVLFMSRRIRRHEEPAAQSLDWLIDGEAWTVGGEFEQCAARFTDIK